MDWMNYLVWPDNQLFYSNLFFTVWTIYALLPHIYYREVGQVEAILKSIKSIFFNNVNLVDLNGLY